jgi:hypothetical protein
MPSLQPAQVMTKLARLLVAVHCDLQLHKSVAIALFQHWQRCHNDWQPTYVQQMHLHAIFFWAGVP